MADASIVIRASLRGERELNKARRKLTEIGLAAQTADKRIAGMASSSNKMESSLKSSTNRFKKHFDELDKMTKMFGTSMIKMFSMMGKAVTLEMGLMGAAMVGFHGLLVAGRGLVKLYHGAMQLLAGGAAAATVALASAAAAIREQQAAMFAYKGLSYGYKELGSNTRMVSSVMRSLTRDADLATVGVENLNAAFAAVSQRSTFTEGSRQLLKGLMDFASAGQPLEQGVKAAGELIGLLQDPKANFSEIKASAEALGPAMKTALDKAGITSADALRKAILSGTLALEGGVAGQFDAVNDTLISRFKKHFTIIREEFADLGDVFLEPLKGSLEAVARNFRVTFMRIRGEIVRFGQGPMQDGIVGTMEKFNDLMVKLVREYLPKVYGMFDRMGEWWNKVSVGWRMIVNSMRPFVEGARVVEKTFMALAGPVWDQVKGAFRQFNQILQDNEEQFVEFGDKLGGVIGAFIAFGHQLKQYFVEALPFINNILEGIRQAITFMTDSFKTLRGLIGGMGTDGFAPFLTLAAALVGFQKMKNTKGGFINTPQKVAAMQVQAANVTITGMTAGGQMYSGATPPALVGGPGGSGVGMPSSAPLGGRGNALQQQAAAIKKANPGMSSQQAMAAARSGYMSGAGGAYLGTGRGMFGLYRSLRNGPAGMSRMDALRYMQRTPVTYNPGANGPGGFGRLGVGIRNARAGAFGQAASKFAGSMSGKLGTGIAMNLAAGFMPEEAQGAMALGSSLAMINPFLGAAVGLGGAAMNSRTAGGGALTGAGAGAAIGTMIAPGVGTAVGAVLGAVAGGIMGHFGKAKAEKKAARAAATEFAEQITGNIMGGITDVLLEKGYGGLTQANLEKATGVDLLRTASGNLAKSLGNDSAMESAIKALYALEDQLGIELGDTLEDALKRPEEFINEFATKSSVSLDAFSYITDKANSKLSFLSDKFRMTDSEILELAKSVGVDLFDATADFDEQVKKLASGMISTAADMNAAFADVLGRQMGVLGTAKAKAAAPRIIDESARALREKILGGGATNEDIFGFFEEQMGGLVDLFGGDEFKATEAFMRMFRDGAVFSQAGGQLEGLGGSFMTPEIQQFLSGFGADFNETLSTVPRAMIENALTARGLQLTGNASQLSNVNAYQASQLRTLVEREDFSTMSADAFKRAFADIGFTDLGVTNFIEPASLAAEKMDDAASRFGQDVTNFKIAVDQIKAALGTGGDTSSPVYNNLAQTMAKHNQINSMVGGSRTITSGYRNFALGSMNSDHVNGRALDLVGSNLGSYANAMNASGGFAEFHGSGQGRHLHTVPGPIGDTNGPAGSGGTTNNYTINVAGGPNADAREVAQIVMSEIQRVQQNHKERR